MYGLGGGGGGGRGLAREVAFASGVCAEAPWEVQICPFIIQLHFVEYKQRPKRVQISRGICTPEDRLDRFPAVDQSVSSRFG